MYRVVESLWNVTVYQVMRASLILDIYMIYTCECIDNTLFVLYIVIARINDNSYEHITVQMSMYTENVIYL